MTALVGYLHEKGWLLGRPRLVTLEEAEDFARHGWTVLVDPWVHEELTRWEQLNRIGRPKWFEAP